MYVIYQWKLNVLKEICELWKAAPNMMSLRKIPVSIHVKQETRL